RLLVARGPTPALWPRLPSWSLTSRATRSGSGADAPPPRSGPATPVVPHHSRDALGFGASAAPPPRSSYFLLRIACLCDLRASGVERRTSTDRSCHSGGFQYPHRRFEAEAR